MMIYNCPKVNTPPIIDGRLDDDAWSHSEAVNLVLSEDGASASKPTRVKLCWDNDHLYLAFDCTDQDIWGTMFNRDDLIWNEEVVEAFLSPDGDLTHYYELNVSPRNVVFDTEISALTDDPPVFKGRKEWDITGLKTAVAVDGTLDDRNDIDRGWSIEIAVPFASLGRKTPKPGEKWRGNLYRIDLSPEPVEFQAWSPTLISPANFHRPSHFGTIVFTE
ncbi:MAG: carbohydrate-binding family 9-like protein [Armatimonadota bacterium]